MEKYSIKMRALHWTVSILIIFNLALGLYMTSVDKTNPMRIGFYSFHKSIGVMILGFVILRFVTRMFSKLPSLPKTFSPLIIDITHIGHYLLYVCMFIMPISGWIMSNAFGYPVSMFGITMPTLIANNPFRASLFATAHEVCGYIFIVLICAHVTAVLVHFIIGKTPEEKILRRML